MMEINSNNKTIFLLGDNYAEHIDYIFDNMNKEDAKEVTKTLIEELVNKYNKLLEEFEDTYNFHIEITKAYLELINSNK